MDSLTGKSGFGFSMGLRTSHYFDGLIGFSVGVGREYPLTQKIALRPQLLVSFGGYKRPDDIYVESTFLEVPLHLIVKPFGKKLIPYFTAGPSLKLDIVSASSYFFADGGFGLEWDLGYSSVAPEFRISLGKEMQVVYFVMNFKM